MFRNCSFIKGILINALLILLIGSILVSCSNSKQAKLAGLKSEQEKLAKEIEALEQEIASENGAEQVKKRTVQVMSQDVATAEFNHYVEVQGKLDGDLNIAVSPQMSGIVTSVLAGVGDKVTQGQLLAQIDDEIYVKQLKDLKNTLSFVTDVFNRQKALWDQKIGSEIEYLKAKNDKESLEQKIATMEEQIELLKIKAPISGTIAESNVRKGQMASPASPLPAYRIINFSRLKVVAEVSEAYAARVHKNDKVLIHLPDISKDLEAVVTFVSDYINPVNRTFLIEADINAPGDDLKANMIAVVKITDYTSPEAISIPIKLIQDDKDGKYTFLIRQENSAWTARKSRISVGQVYNGVAEILGGIQPGDKIVTVGFLELNDGDLVSF